MRWSSTAIAVGTGRNGLDREEENASGVNLLVMEEDRNELPNLANDGVAISPRLGE